MAILSRLRRCFSSKPSASTACRRRQTAPPRPLPINYLDRGDGDGTRVADLRGSATATCRIQNELKAMNENSPTHCSFGPVSDDIFQWEGVIIGPSYTCYEGGIFHLSIQFPPDYPSKPPEIKFQTKIYHPNIEENGRIHIDILEENWSPALTIEKLLLSICSILADPNAIDSNNEASEMYKNEWLSYWRTAREWTNKYAMGS